ncbi:MAG: ribosomal protein S18-alanine N-acetyltransferase [Oscillospiraceae bacterium]|nr:ribosomal protein S18-alanine N-acetyltransferase [Oscillospiraceae bacterium]
MSIIHELYNIERCCFDNPWTSEMLESELESALSVLVTEKIDGKTVGYALGRVVADESELLKICVLMDYRKRGIAEKMLSVLLEKMREKGAAACFLEVRSRNEPAISLYEKLGFEKIATRRNYYPDDDAVVMKRSETT